MDINYSYTHRGYTNGQKHEKFHNRKNNLSLGPKQTPYLLRSMYDPATEITKKNRASDSTVVTKIKLTQH